MEEFERHQMCQNVAWISAQTAIFFKWFGSLNTYHLDAVVISESQTFIRTSPVAALVTLVESVPNKS